MTPAFRRPLATLAATLAVVAGVAVLLPRWLAPPAAPEPRDSPCDLNRGPCSVALAGERTIELSITPRPLPVMRPLRVQLTTHGFAATAVQLEFTGVAMDMGFNRVDLRRDASGAFSGEATLPVCVTGSMEWQATVLIRDGDPPTTIAFRFRAPLAAADRR